MMIRATSRPSTWATFKVLVGFALLLFTAGLVGDIVRGENSPWIWREFANPRHVTGGADAAVVVVLYLCFYALGFLLPYWAAMLALVLPALTAPSSEERRQFAMTPVRHTACVAIGIAGLILYLLLLEPILAFFRAIPWHLWAGWPLALGVLAAGALVFIAIVQLGQESARLAQRRVSTPRDRLHAAQLAADDN